MKKEGVRGLSLARSRSDDQGSSPSGSSVGRRRKGVSSGSVGVFVPRLGIIRPRFETLSPPREGPVVSKLDSEDSRSDGWAHWLCRALVPTAESSCFRSDLRLLLGIIGAPLEPVHVHNNEPLPHLGITDTPIHCIQQLSMTLMASRRSRQNTSIPPSKQQ